MLKHNRNQGFTLIELLITVAVAMVLLVVAVPSVRAMLQNNRVSSQANELFTSLNLARSEALKQQRNVCLTALDASAAGNELGAGWKVWVDGPNGTAGTQHASEPTLVQTDALLNGATVDVTPNTSQIFFRPDGTASATTFARRNPDCRGADAARNISVATVGRVSVSKASCP